MPISELNDALARYGLRLRGGFATDSEVDRDVLAEAPWARAVILVGNVGSELWDRSGAEITAMTDPDPLDQWTRQTIDPIARSVDGTALYPFDGPPYWPFQRWAERAEGVRSSPIGIQIHPEYGLWHAYRAAILLRNTIHQPRREHAHPCDACVDRPCLTHCPVNAFSVDGYDVDRCVDYVVAAQHDSRSCSGVGCLARLACPVGADWRYQADHARFHMKAFVKARLRARERNS
ncbi:ferredoxin [Dongia deserti]|uniref:ferredoxin n=1 Tax=Dongia deserti TaxID=2268030 RepID=UPI00254962B1|nr:ferredoxin [Dongia deserti]